MRCLGCANVSLKEHPKHAREGMGHCKFDDVGRFQWLTKERECGRYVAVDEDKGALREAWLIRQNSTGSMEA